jgi:hypothetical protein
MTHRQRKLRSKIDRRKWVTIFMGGDYLDRNETGLMWIKRKLLTAARKSVAL